MNKNRLGFQSLKAFPSSSTELMSPIDSDFSGYYWNFARDVVEKWILSDKVIHNEEGFLAEDDVAIDIVIMEIRNLIVGLCFEERAQKVIYDREARKALSSIKGISPINKLKLIRTNQIISSLITTEAEWLLDIQKSKTTLNSCVKVMSWYGVHNFKKSSLSRVRTIVLWHLKRVEFFLNYVGYSFDFHFICKLIAELVTLKGQLEDDLILESMRLIKNGKFSKADLTDSHFNNTLMKKSMEEDISKLKRNLKKFGLKSSSDALRELDINTKDSELDNLVGEIIVEGELSKSLNLLTK